MNASLRLVAPGRRYAGHTRFVAWLFLVALGAAVVAPASPAVATGDELADVLVEADAIRFAPRIEADEWLLQVTGVDGVVLRREIAADAATGLVVPLSGERALAPGHYTYSLYARIDADGPRRVQAGGFALDGTEVSLVASAGEGSFALAEIMGPGLGAAGAASAFDFVINDDLVVIGSTCIGFDCFNNVQFSFTTLALSENNLRITFHDTSTVSSYPRNDWQLEANESSNGGSNHFAIIDCGTNASVGSCGGNRVFRVQAGAPANSLFVDSAGNLGVRTDPILEVHARANDTPGLRLEQDNSAGWPPQTWDVAGNETNFFVRDVTNGSTLPFRIRPGAPSNMVYIDDDGVAIGKTSPEGQLEVSSGAAGRTGLRVGMPASPTAAAALFTVGNASRVEFMAGGKQSEGMRVHLLDNGGDEGPYVFIRRNNNGSTPAAGSLVMEAITGLWAIWVDNSANLRVANQLGVRNITDTAGTVVGTQTSWFGAKNDVSPWDPRGSLQQITELPLFSFRFARDSQRGDKLNQGLVVFEDDRDAWWVMNAAANQTPVLDEANLFGRLIGAIQELDGIVDGLEAEVDAQRATIDELTARLERLEAALARGSGQR